MGGWRDELEGEAALDVARLDDALGVALTHRIYAEALIDPRGHLFQRLEYVGDALLDVSVLRALVALEPWSETSLAFLSGSQQAMVSDHALGRVAGRRGLPDVRTFAVSQHRLGDRIEACIGAVWADQGLAAAESTAQRLVVTPGLRGRHPQMSVPDFDGDDAYEAAARVCGYDPVASAWFGAAASGGSVRRRLALVGNAVLEAAMATSQYVEDELATEAQMSEERRGAVSNRTMAARARELGLADGAGDEPDRRSLADEVQALVGAVALDGGMLAAFEVAGGVLGRRPAPGPVAFPA